MALHKPKQLYVLGKLCFSSIKPMKMIEIWLKITFILDLLQNCMVGRSWHPEHVCSLNLTFISNSFWNKGRKVSKCWNFYEKREITPKWVMG
jgi:hypothetical protein